MHVNVLIENTTTRSGLIAEHGLSLLIETCGRRILFDTGASPAFAGNAEALGIDLNTVDIAILSHGHYDHGGGIARFLELNSHAPVWLSRHAFEPHFNASGKDIGLSPALTGNPRFRTAPAEVLELAPGISLHPARLLPTTYPVAGEGMSTLEKGHPAPDDFRHEQYLLIEEHGRRILFSGCSHRGILNIATHFHPDILIGGFHLRHTPPQQIIQTAEILQQLPTYYYTGHCTGDQALTQLQQCLGSRLQSITTGQTIIL